MWNRRVMCRPSITKNRRGVAAAVVPIHHRLPLFCLIPAISRLRLNQPFTPLLHQIKPQTGRNRRRPLGSNGSSPIWCLFHQTFYLHTCITTSHHRRPLSTVFAAASSSFVPTNYSEWDAYILIVADKVSWMPTNHVAEQ